MLKVLFTKEDDFWIAQCLDKDICAQSPRLEKLPESFKLAFLGHIAVRKSHNMNGDVWEDVHKAPVQYWDLYNEGLKMADDIVRIDFDEYRVEGLGDMADLIENLTFEVRING